MPNTLVAARMRIMPSLKQTLVELQARYRREILGVLAGASIQDSQNVVAGPRAAAWLEEPEGLAQVGQVFGYDESRRRAARGQPRRSDGRVDG